MHQFKHFSFDLWFTLIRSNPVFKKERAGYFYTHLNALKKSLPEVEAVFRSVDDMCNAINEKTGKNIDAEEMYLMVLYQLNGAHPNFSSVDMQGLYNEMEALIIKHIPEVFNADTPVILDRIKQLQHTTVSILSNTAFVKGSTLRKVNEQLGLAQYFDFQVYSDEVGVSKPNAAMYDILLKNVYEVRPADNILLHEIIHIGDNPVADIQGAQARGIHAFQINTNDKLITHLFN